MQANCLMKVDTCNYLIFGAGISGLSVAEYLTLQGKNFRIMDSREIPPNAAAIQSLLDSSHISFGEIKQQWMEQADVIVLSPGVSPHLPELEQAKARGVEIVGDIELFAREVKAPYIAITGSNGKSTVTTLVTEILKSQALRVKACANIGEPALSAISEYEADIYVLELSSFQLETCQSLKPLASVVLNICDDHLDRHKNVDQYASIKTKIYQNAQHKITARDDSIAKYLSDYQSDASFGLDAPIGNNFGVVEDRTGRWLVRGDRKIIDTNELPLLGATGELNVLAALALTYKFIENEAKAIIAIKSFKGLPHRCESVAEHNNIQWIDDSKATNIAATVCAISGLNDPIILIVGGIHKGGSMNDLLNTVKEKVSSVIAFGKDKQIFIDALKDSVDVKDAASLSESVELAHKMAKPGHTVLFSPACASFDMFASYIHRGIAFQAAVRKIIQDECDGL